MGVVFIVLNQKVFSFRPGRSVPVLDVSHIYTYITTTGFHNLIIKFFIN